MKYFYVLSLAFFSAVFLFGCGKIDSQFPLPDSVDEYSELANGDQVNFQTDLTSEEVYEFYKNTFTSQGLTERELLTVKDGTTLSVVFDGNEKGAIVVQAVNLQNGKTNVNIRFDSI